MNMKSETLMNRVGLQPFGSFIPYLKVLRAASKSKNRPHAQPMMKLHEPVPGYAADLHDSMGAFPPGSEVPQGQGLWDCVLSGKCQWIAVNISTEGVLDKYKIDT